MKKLSETMLVALRAAALEGNGGICLGPFGNWKFSRATLRALNARGLVEPKDARDFYGWHCITAEGRAYLASHEGERYCSEAQDSAG